MNQSIPIIAAPRAIEAAVPNVSVGKLMRGPVWFGLVTIAVFFGLFGGWAAMAPLSSGAVAYAVVGPASNTKVIQHLEGGIIRTIHVHEGQTVKAGDPLVTLESVGAEARFSTRQQQWLRLTVVRARLEAHEAGLEDIVLPRAAASSTDPDLVAFIANQRRLFETQRRSQVQLAAISEQQIQQYQSEINAVEAQNAGLATQLDLIGQQLDDAQALLAKQLIPTTQVRDMQRNQAELQSAVAANNARIARSGQAIEEIKLTQLQREETFRVQVADDMTQTNNDISTVEGDMTSSEDVLRRTEITSPVDGVVLNFRNQTIGGIVRPGDPIMDVVPLSEDMIVLAHLSPRDIDLVSVGLKAHVNLSPFASRNMLPLEGEITQIAPDTTTDETTRQTYYEVRIRIAASELAKHKGIYMSPGMPADVTVVTGERSMLQYLAEPLLRSIRSAFVYD